MVRRLKNGVDLTHSLIDLRGNPTMSDVPALREYRRLGHAEAFRGEVFSA